MGRTPVQHFSRRWLFAVAPAGAWRAQTVDYGAVVGNLNRPTRGKSKSGANDDQSRPCITGIGTKKSAVTRQATGPNTTGQTTCLPVVL